MTFGPHLRDGAILKHAKKLKWVQAVGTGVDGIIDQPLLSPNVIVTNIRGIHGEAVSEAALAGMLALSRNLPESLRNQAAQKWVRWPSRLIHGKTVGIYGIGLIAEALAPRCKAMGMTVIGFTSTVRQVPGFDRMLLREEFVNAAGELDYLVVLVPISDETRNIIGTREFAAMKPGSYFINLARGGVVDEDAMMAALDFGQARRRRARRVPDRAAVRRTPAVVDAERDRDAASRRLLRHLCPPRAADHRAQHGMFFARRRGRHDQPGAAIAAMAKRTATKRKRKAATRRSRRTYCRPACHR